MATIILRTQIEASPEACFDLARSQRAHIASTSATDERIVHGPSTDLMEVGDSVTFEAKHLGMVWRLTAEIVEFDPPIYFTDVMRRGPFKSMEHIHRFASVGTGTEMTDELTFTSPLGLIGRIAEVLFLNAHMRRFLASRAKALKGLAEDGADARRALSNEA